MKILVANIGSTSFKYRLFDIETSVVLAQGRVERIGQPGGNCPNYAAAIAQCLGEIVGAGKPLANITDLSAVGFKAVLAGPIMGARLVDEEVLAAMEEFAFFAPAHNPPYIAAMRAFQHAAPAVPLVALFETSFYTKVPDGTYTYGVPIEWRDRFGIRRYGFHGASHRAASERVQEASGSRHLRHISCHLGGSSSIAAIRNGVAIDCSFGMSPQSGLSHNNRTGDLDTFAVLFMMKKLSLGPDEMAKVLSTQSGLAGISGTSGDARDLTDGAAAGNDLCRLAIDVFVREIRRYIGAFHLEPCGLDVLSFTGGIGENAVGIREQICRNLDHLGLKLDAAANASARGEAWIHAPESKVRVLILPADEERIVARASAEVLYNLQSNRATSAQTLS
jgi:acetate kinase